MNLLPKSISAPSRHSTMSNNLVYGNDQLINVDGYDSKTNLKRLPSTTSALRALIEQGILKQAPKQRIPKTSHFIDRDYLGLCVCNITVDTIILPHKAWQFSFDLWVKNKSKWYYHTFRMNRDNFKQLHANISFNEHNTDKGQSILFFPQQSYPKPPKLTELARSEETKECMLKEMDYLKKPQLPKTWGILKKSANMEYATKYAQYLQSCFTSLSLLIQDWFYELLGDDGLNKPLSKYIMSVSHKRLNTMIAKTYAKNCSIKRLSRRNEFKFHTCYITTRPLHDPSSDLLNFNHWALKFEGELSLLTIEFFAAQKGVKIRQYMNSTMSRRIFWYWWDPDPVKEAINAENEVENLVYFTRRWKVIERFTFEDSKLITAPLLSHIVEKWLLTGHNKKYHVFKNNCQHFVRDIVAVLDRKVALSLNSFLDHTTLTNLIPVVAIGDGLAEHARTLEISKQLGDALNEYGRKAKQKKLAKNHERMGKARIRSMSNNSYNDEEEKEYVKVEYRDLDDNNNHNNNNNNNQMDKQQDINNENMGNIGDNDKYRVVWSRNDDNAVNGN